MKSKKWKMKMKKLRRKKEVKRVKKKKKAVSTLLLKKKTVTEAILMKICMVLTMIYHPIALKAGVLLMKMKLTVKIEE